MVCLAYCVDRTYKYGDLDIRNRHAHIIAVFVL